MIDALLTAMDPRDHAAAGRAVSVLCLVGAAVTVVFAPLQPGEFSLSPAGLAVGAANLSLVVGVSWSARRFDEANRLAWALVPLLAIVAIVDLDYLTQDASVAAQIFFLFPALYGASQLRRVGAAVITGAAVAGEWIVVGGMLPLRDAVTDAGYVTAALATTAILLIRAGERQARLVARLQRQAAIDPLTGLVTRRVLDEAAQSAMTGAAGVGGTSLILLDVDQFKSINDRFGHPSGDEILIQLGELLVAGSRDEDVVSRLGGDEIALLLPGTSVDDLQRRADQILWDVRTHPFATTEGVHVSVSVSIGTAHAPTHAVDLRSLYVAADAALYRAKQSGRDQVAAASV
jgi:diguanylate cyclase (GGDEF)-like protein